jgi:hypothetical protein
MSKSNWTKPKDKAEGSEPKVDKVETPNKANFKQIEGLCKKFDTYEEAAAYRETLTVDPVKNKTRIRRRTGGDRVVFETIFFGR